MQKNQTKKAALYIRVSTHYQIDKDSLPFQRNELINYAKYALGIDDYAIFEDAGYSGKNTDRPAYQDMMRRIRAKEFSHLCVWKIDRISRNLLDFAAMYEELKKFNCTFVSKNEQFDTSSAIGEAMLRIILVFAELERKLTAERVTSIMYSRANKGLWNGAPIPLGYKWDAKGKYPVIDEDTAVVVRYIYDQYEKIHSTMKLSDKLNRENIKSARGGEWTGTTVKGILRNPFYKGTYRYNYKTQTGRIKPVEEQIIHEDNHPGIIDKEQWDRVNKILDENSTRSVAQLRSNVKYTHIFSKLLRCGQCGHTMGGGLDRALGLHRRGSGLAVQILPQRLRYGFFIQSVQRILQVLLHRGVFLAERELQCAQLLIVKGDGDSCFFHVRVLLLYAIFSVFVLWGGYHYPPMVARGFNPADVRHYQGQN